MEVHLDDTWNETIAGKTCKEKEDHARLKIRLKIPSNGTWSDIKNGTLSQSQTPHVWFFAFSDCKARINKVSQVGLKLDYELFINNSDNSEFTIEESGLLLPYLILTTVISCFFVIQAWRYAVWYR